MTNKSSEGKGIKELEKIYGKSELETDVIGIGSWKLGDNIKFKDGICRKLLHIEYRNMAVDLLHFEDGTQLFTDEIKNNFTF